MQQRAAGACLFKCTALHLCARPGLNCRATFQPDWVDALELDSAIAFDPPMPGAVDVALQGSSAPAVRCSGAAEEPGAHVPSLIREHPTPQSRCAFHTNRVSWYSTALCARSPSGESESMQHRPDRRDPEAPLLLSAPRARWCLLNSALPSARWLLTSACASVCLRCSRKLAFECARILEVAKPCLYPPVAPPLQRPPCSPGVGHSGAGASTRRPPRASKGSFCEERLAAQRQRPPPLLLPHLLLGPSTADWRRRMPYLPCQVQG